MIHSESVKIVDGHLAKYTPTVIGGSAIAILIPRISAWIILNRVGFFRVLIGICPHIMVSSYLMMPVLLLLAPILIKVLFPVIFLGDQVSVSVSR